MSRTQNLALLLTDIVGFSERTARQTRAEQAALLRDHDRLLIPLVRAFRGRYVKSIGDAILAVFASPTDALKCGMAMQDALFERNRGKGEAEVFHIRVAVNLGEVRLAPRDVFGEAMNTAARLEGVTPGGEVWFTEAVFLSMNKAEVCGEFVREETFKGASGPVRVFRVPPRREPRLTPEGQTPEAACPFGGMHRQAPEPEGAAAGMFRRATEHHLLDGLSARPLLASGVAATLLVVLAAVFVVVPRGSPLLTAIRVDMLAGRWDRVEKAADEALRADPEDADALLVKGHVLYARGGRDAALEHYQRALARQDRLKDEEEFSKNLLDALGRPGEKAEMLAKRHPPARVVDTMRERVGNAGFRERRQAVRILDGAGLGRGIDRFEVAAKDLQQGPDVQDRLQAVRDLRALKDRRAVPYLKEVTGGLVVNRLKNGILQDEAKAAILELEGEEPAPARREEAAPSPVQAPPPVHVESRRRGNPE